MPRSREMDLWSSFLAFIIKKKTIIKQLNEGGEVRFLPQIKEYVKPFSIRDYNNIDVEVLNKFEKIFIFPHRTKCYRFATI